MKQVVLNTPKRKDNRSGVVFSLSFSSLTLLIVALIFAACKKEKISLPQPEPSYHLNVSIASIAAPASAGSSTNVSIEANAAWKLTLPEGVDWLEVNKTNGEGNDAVQVKITGENKTGAKRTATITVALVNGKVSSKSISVEQDFIISNPVAINWKKLLGGNGNDYGYSIIKTNGGGYLLSGRTSSSNSGDVAATKGGIDMWVVKLDADGAMSWQKTYGGNGDEYSVASAATPDGGYVLTGFTTSNNNGDVGQNHGNTDFWVIKINASGVLQWQKTLGGNGDDRPFAVTITTEGRIGVAGYTTSSNNGDVSTNHGNEDMWVLLLDNGNGNFLWKKTLGGNGSERAKALAPAPNGGLFVGGTTTSNDNGDVGVSKGNTDFWVLQLDRSLSIVWKNNLGGSNNEDLNALAVGPNNTIVAAGSTKSNNSGDVGSLKGGEDFWVAQLNASNGAMGWQKVLGGSAIDVAKSVLVKPNGTIVVAGYTYSNNSGDVETAHGAGDFWVVQLNSNGSLGWKKLLGGDNEDLGYAIAESSDGGFAIAGSTISNSSGDVGPARGNSDVWVVKMKQE